MRRSLVASPLLVSVTLASISVAATPAKQREKGAAAGARGVAKPAIGTFGFDVAGMDRNVRPGNDFASYAGGTWE